MRPVPGQWATSRQGRDLDQHYIVIGETPDGYLLLADGKKRTVSRPKKKNWKHVVVHPDVDPDLRRSLLAGTPPADREVEAALNRFVAGEGVGERGETGRDRGAGDGD